MRSTIALLALVAGAGCADATALEVEEGDAAIDEERARMAGAEAMRPEPIHDQVQIARAEVEECFASIGGQAGEPPCAGNAVPKIPQTDLASGARSGGFAYFGTVANTACTMTELFVPGVEPFATDDLVCEFGAGEGAVLGDHRPPRILRLDLANDRVEDITPDDERIDSTFGLFATIAHEDVVMLAGPNVGPEGIDGVNVFAIRGSSGEGIASTTLQGYVGFTDSVVVDGELYIGAKRADGSGAVLRWVGNPSEPFGFRVVGELESAPNALVEHRGRIAAAGHAGTTLEGEPAAMPAIYLSPEISGRGLLREQRGEWQRIFEMDDYEPVDVIARATGFGDLASYQGRLYFTTEQAPFAGTLAAFDAYGRPDTWYERLMTHAHASRAVSLLVMDDVGTERQQVTLLYGYESVPTLDGEVRAVQNALGQEPMHGPAGIAGLNHMAELVVHEGRLYVGTFDASTIGPELLEPLSSQDALLGLPQDVVDVLQPIADELLTPMQGADLYRMDAPYAPLVAEDLSGLGNGSNYGFNVLLPVEDELYIGTSNPYNLRVGGDDPGGWELLKLTPAM